MKKSLIYTVIILSAVFASGSLAETMGWNNPLVEQRADPQVFLHTDGYYYMAATVPAYDRIEIRRAKTIDGLSTAKAETVWTRHERGPMSAHIWAPEIHFIDGKWYIYFTASRVEDLWGGLRIYSLETDAANPLEGEWKENGQFKLNWESFSLDATTFVHKGVRYFLWTQIDPGIDGTNIYIARMDSPTSIVGDAVCLTRPDYEWERRRHWVNEGPAVLIRHGKVFIAYSASATDANYCMGLLTADADSNLLDPRSWEKSPEPVFKSCPENSQYGPGHNSFTTTPDGKTDILVYHARNYEHIQGNPLRNPDRATRAQELKWNEDGTPDFSVPVADGPYTLAY